MTHPFVASSNVLHRTFSHKPEKVVGSSGIKLIFESGRHVYDASAGPAVSVLGHTRSDVTEALVHQMNECAYIYSGARFTSTAVEDLASFILRDRPGGLSKAIFVNSGSEATDAAIKLATQYWHEVGQPRRRFVIARKQSYHGNTIGALCVSGHDSRRSLYHDWLSSNVKFIDPCFSYRFKKSHETDEDYAKRLVLQFESLVLELGPENVSSFIAETVSGTTLGCATAVQGYFKGIREVCDRYGVLLILDEIMCGMGKTGTMHAWEQEDMRGPDIQTIGKALGGGFIPLSGVLLHHKIFDALSNGSKGLAHGHTFQAHPVACAAALAVQKAIENEKLLENVVAMGAVLEGLLKEHITPLNVVGDVRGRGLFWSVEFMLDGHERVPLPIESNFGARVVDRALNLGLNILGNLGQTGSVYVDHVILSPAYVVTEEELRQIVSLLRTAIMETTEEAFKWLNRGVIDALV
ncbi:hypothetical protein PFICI_06095 [Pestalotiopsis fici W106-1]|uniref:Aminotransferase n=1 Tax=Pestalotiopsis fici (strain W106-1 / CGMCC3.15140) TaxID=1229662 RepID=W3X4N5_PESFW|nr:uncharacterized protein PFICI_06095 [Pestalotiopsis fici W106-1]ETS81093.1 hypothetical protein PFICI_06095 [Pestalotiopsis fici W106-1]